MPTLRHDDVRDELLDGLTDAGRDQYERFAAVYEARQIASRLAALRRMAKLSQRETAKRAGVDQADLSRIESAQIIPSLPTLLRLLDAVGARLILGRETTSRPVSRAPAPPRGRPTKPAKATASRRLAMPAAKKNIAASAVTTSAKVAAKRTA